MRLTPLLFAAFFAVVFRAAAADSLVYKQAQGRDLRLFVDRPADWRASDRRPAIVFFFGGSWIGGRPEQFAKQSAYLASRGLVGFRVQYRVIPKDDAGPPVVCCQDAKSAFRYVRAHAAELGVDPQRIAGAGGSAGGHLAAFAGLVDGQDDPGDDTSISCRPDALILFNPVFDNGPGQWGHERVKERYREFSPAHNVTSAAPPAIVFLGEEDRLIPRAVLTAFQSKMKDAGVRCDTHIYPKAQHGFFNHDPHFTLTLIAADRFLASLNWLEGPPSLSAPSAP